MTENNKNETLLQRIRESNRGPFKVFIKEEPELHARGLGFLTPLLGRWHDVGPFDGLAESVAKYIKVWYLGTGNPERLYYGEIVSERRSLTGGRVLKFRNVPNPKFPDGVNGYVCPDHYTWLKIKPGF